MFFQTTSIVENVDSSCKQESKSNVTSLKGEIVAVSPDVAASSTSQMSDVEPRYQAKHSLSSSGIESTSLAIPSYIKENHDIHSGHIIKRAVPSSYYIHLSTLLLASLTKATNHSPLIFQVGFNTFSCSGFLHSSSNPVLSASLLSILSLSSPDVLKCAI